MLIDTNVWSELARPRPHTAVLQWMSEHFDECMLSALVLGEMQYGIALAETEDRRRDLEAFQTDLLDRLDHRVWPWDDAAARAWGPLRAKLKRMGRLIGERDMLIAAHALSLDIPLVTRNVSEMECTDVRIIDPWQA